VGSRRDQVQQLGCTVSPIELGSQGRYNLTVDADTLVTNDLVAQTTHEGNHSTLRRSVVEELGVADGLVDGSVHHNGRASRKARQRGLGEVEERVDVGVEDVVPLLRAEIRQMLDGLLSCVVEDARIKY
jgi:hypothetical protein